MLVFAGTSVMTAPRVVIAAVLAEVRHGLPLVAALGRLAHGLRPDQHRRHGVFSGERRAQRNAYATGVLVLIAGASCTSYVDLRNQWRQHGGFGRSIGTFWLLIVAVVFVLITVVVCFHAGGGLAISAFFIAAILGLSVFFASHARR